MGGWEMCMRERYEERYFFFQAEDGIRAFCLSRGLGDMYKGQKLLESPKQGRGFKKAVLMDVRGSKIGMFDDMGSVYVANIVRPEGNPIPHAAFS